MLQTKLYLPAKCPARVMKTQKTGGLVEAATAAALQVSFFDFIDCKIGRPGRERHI